VSGEPRFEWRGVMLDVARHFFSVDDVKRFIDTIAPLQLNRLHLHLTDDQGWRLEITSWPKLAEVGGRTAVGGGPGGFYTQAEYRDLVAYAADREIAVVPEIDMPGHVNAALVAYPELAPAGVEPAPYTGIDVGFSTLDAANELTYRFVDDVLREVAALTPGAYVHIGGDEALSTQGEDYARFMARVFELVRSHGKQVVGWEEIAKLPLPPGALVQHWKDGELALRAVEQGARVIMSPATRTYLDMKLDATTKLGLEWAGYVSVRDASNWDPATQVEGVGEADVIGVEACIWSETLETFADVEYMAFPRLVGVAGVARGAVTRRPV
jgi:hexosaminidase